MAYTDEQVMDALRGAMKSLRRGNGKGHRHGAHGHGEGREHTHGAEHRGGCCGKHAHHGAHEHGAHGEGQERAHGHHGHHGEHGGHGRHHAERLLTGRERILGRLDTETGTTQTALADKIGIRPQSLSELLTKLEADGFVTRTRDEEDKRATLVFLTEAGKARAEEVAKERAAAAAEFLAPLTAEEKEQLVAILAKLKRPEAKAEDAEA